MPADASRAGRLPGLRRAVVVAFVLLVGAPIALSVAAAPEGASTPRAHAVVEPWATYPLRDPFDYADVILLGNNNSAVSRNLTALFQTARNVPSNNVFLADLTVAETISASQWSAFASWLTQEMANRSLGPGINYIVTFKGMPIRVSWSSPSGPTSFQDALMLLGGNYEAYIGTANLWSNPYFNRTEPFSFARYGIRLVTGIYAYNESTAAELINRSVNSLGSRGEFVLDVDSSKGYSNSHGTYGYANSALVWANATLSAAGQRVYLDTTTTYVTSRTGVIGYSSWGSNDCCWPSVTPNAKPNNTWVNGSIGETFVSTGGRTFTWPPSYGQSLIADWIDEGANGMKGYTDEPYINAIADGHILYSRYTRGYNLAESYWAASWHIGWRQIVVGDPKMSPYADIPDLSVNASLTAAAGPAVQFGVLNVTLGLDNTAAVDVAVPARLSLDGGNTTWNETLRAPAHRAAAYNLSIDVSLVGADVWGTQALTITLDPDGAVVELNEANNSFVLPVQIWRRPVASAALASSSVYTFETATLGLGAIIRDRDIGTFEIEIDGADMVPILAVDNRASYTTSFIRSGVHTFKVTAVDTASLRSDPLGPLVLTVLNREPAVALTANEVNPLSGVPVLFSSVGSSDLDGAIASYAWEAGAFAGTGPNFTVAFPRPGNYTVNLTITDDEGATNSTSITIMVGNRAPVSALSANVSSALTFHAVAFSGEASADVDGSIVSFRFLFDDGAVVVNDSGTAEHSFATPLAHVVTLVVTDDWGATAETRTAVEILNRPPALWWAGGQNFTTFEGAPLHLRAGFSDLDGNATSYTLEFADGRRAQGVLSAPQGEVTANHTYASEGNYTVNLTVWDEVGGSTSLPARITVTHPAPQLTLIEVNVLDLNLTVDYVLDSPFMSIELMVELDGAPWKSVPVDAQGTARLRLPSLTPGIHSLTFYITDGVKTSRTFDVGFSVEAPPAHPPLPLPDGGATGTGGGASAALVAGMLVAAAAVAGATLILLRRSRRRELE